MEKAPNSFPLIGHAAEHVIITFSPKISARTDFS
jgi:hypothetical protein